MRIAHFSTLHDRSPASLRAAVGDLLVGPDRVEVLTVTEISANDRAGAVGFADHTLVRANQHVHGRGSDECGILVRDSAYTVISTHFVHVSDHEFQDGHGNTHPGWWATTAVLRNVTTGQTEVVSVAHAPSSVDSRHGWSSARNRVKSYRAGVQRWAAHLGAIDVVRHPAGMVVAADWNRSLDSPFTTHYLERAFRGYKVGWRGFNPGGSHGKRLIDGVLVHGYAVDHARVLTKTPASDHRPTRFELLLEHPDPPPKEHPVTARGFCPFATNRNIPPGSNDPSITPRVAILHVDAGNADSLYDFFKNRSGGIESHFFIKKSGEIEQYRSVFFQADANLDANSFAVSIETQGLGVGEWNTAQLVSIKKLLTWLSTAVSIPLRKVDRWDGSGVGYHTQFGAPGHWTPVAKTCPGPDRIRQFDRVLVPWMNDDVPPMDPHVNQVTMVRAAFVALLAQADHVPADRVIFHAKLDKVRAAVAEMPDH